MSAPPIGLLGLGGYVPERVMTNEEWAEHVDTSDAWIRERTGIERRRVAADDETTLDLAAAAAEVALEDAGVDVEEIDEIVVATDTPEVFTPDTAAFLQHRLGARGVPAYDLGGSGCAGFVLGLDLARARVAQALGGPGERGRHEGPAGRHNVLVVGVELITRLMDWKDRNTCVLFGDGAGAVIVGAAADAAEILAVTAGTDGSQAEILWLEAGGTRLPFTRAVAERGDHRNLVMQGREVFREAVRHMTEAATQVLERVGASPEDVALVVPHQANRRIIDSVGNVLGVDPERVYVNVQEYGNTGSASVPLALWEARGRGRVSPGDLVLLTAFGAGFHWAAALVRF